MHENRGAWIMTLSTDPTTDPATTEPDTTELGFEADPAPDGRADALVERLFGGLLGGMELLSVEIGRRLGLYDALRRHGPVRYDDFAACSGVAARYAREWLEQQAVAGVVEVDDQEAQPAGRRYRLPDAHAAVLVDTASPTYFTGCGPFLMGLAQAVPDVAAGYLTGTGVPYAGFGAEIRHGIELFNRPMYTHELAGWLDALPEVRARLQAGTAEVLDVGCGVGWSSIALARAFPGSTVHGVDSDEASITAGRGHAEEAGLADRVTFEVRNAADPIGDPARYGLACIFEALHDMGDPVGVLRRIRAVLEPGAPVLVADERVADTFIAPGDEVERFMYSFSVLHCLPATMAESTAVANGTVLRESTVRDWAAQAGYGTVTVLPIDNDFLRFYRLDTPEM
jgi:SAM-dependent methyltransferase